MTKILFLEDDVVLAESVIDFLEDEGFDISYAKDGQEALALCESNDFDLCVLDVNVPLINGFDLLSRLRDKGDETPAFF
jgi:DNA-binding response OmpR family regulator